MEMLFAICYNVRAYIANGRLRHFTGKLFAGAEDVHRMGKAAAEGVSLQTVIGTVRKERCLRWNLEQQYHQGM